MAGRSRLLRRLFFVLVILAVAALAVRALGDRHAARDLLPAGAALALEVRGAGELFERIEGTRFAVTFFSGPTWAWLEQTEAVRALDGLRAGVGAAIGFTPRRRHILDLVGSDAAIAWYPPSGGAPGALEGARWVAAGRLSLRAWALSAAARLGARLGLAGGIARETVGATTVATVGTGTDAVHVFAAGRLFAASSDRSLAHAAARLAGGDGTALTGAEDWKRVFAALPADGALRVWTRGDLLPGWAAGEVREPVRAAGAVVSAHEPATIDIFVDAPDPSRLQRSGSDTPPGLALAAPAPLFFHAAAGSPPLPLVDLIEQRAAAVARRGGQPAPPLPPRGRGFALAVTGAAEGGLFPRPQGILAVGMRDPGAARQALRLLFPPGARSAAGRWGEALSTRESFPLAGEFELWGTAAGDRLVLATDRALLEALDSGAAPGDGPGDAADPGFRPLDSVTTLDLARLLPALRRYAAPLSGLLSARYGLPDVSRDFDLLAAVRSVAVITGASPAGFVSRTTLELGDLPTAH